MLQSGRAYWEKLPFWSKEKRRYLVLPKHRLVYARIPKAANTSIKYTLHDFLFGPQEDIKKQVTRDIYWQQHKSALTDFLDIKALQKNYSDFFVFSFVRNPFCRIASCYYEKIAQREQRGLPSAFQGKGFREGMSFHDFVEHIASIKDKNANEHFCSQSSMLQYRGVAVCDFIGRVENMDADWTSLQKQTQTKLGFSLPPIRKVHQASNRPKTAEMYDAGLIRTVKERYASDFDLYYPDLQAP